MVSAGSALLKGGLDNERLATVNFLRPARDRAGWRFPFHDEMKRAGEVAKASREGACGAREVHSRKEAPRDLREGGQALPARGFLV